MPPALNVSDQRLRAIDDVLLVAGVFENQGEDRLNHRCKVGSGAGDNHGQLVEWWQGIVGIQPGQPWCMAYAMSMGVLTLGRKTTVSTRFWPLPLTGGCQWLYDWAKATKRKDLVFTAPQRGDIFLLWESSLTPPRYGHTGYVTGVSGNGIATIEGNTNNDGSRNGWKVLRRQRTPSGLAFIRWVNLLYGASA